MTYNRLATNRLATNRLSTNRLATNRLSTNNWQPTPERRPVRRRAAGDAGRSRPLQLHRQLRAARRRHDPRHGRRHPVRVPRQRRPCAALAEAQAQQERTRLGQRVSPGARERARHGRADLDAREQPGARDLAGRVPDSRSRRRPSTATCSHPTPIRWTGTRAAARIRHRAKPAGSSIATAGSPTRWTDAHPVRIHLCGRLRRLHAGLPEPVRLQGVRSNRAATTALSAQPGLKKWPHRRPTDRSSRRTSSRDPSHQRAGRCTRLITESHRAHQLVHGHAAIGGGVE